MIEEVIGILRETFEKYNSGYEFLNIKLFYSYNKVSVSDKDFLANEQSAFQEAARMLKRWGLPVNREIVRLHNEYSSAECPHRSVELHAGYKFSQRAPVSVVNKKRLFY